jgi:hypothetical protein
MNLSRIIILPITVIWSIFKAIAGTIFPKYGLKQARLIYSITLDPEDAKTVEHFEWKVRRRYGNKAL